uniref:Uncharacterized protein n=1 Tax=Oryza sativa subsp. japonica TaxID=39947 RepID=Q69LQ3_ORYSJ|nr:hypothetical protein [Oryza sativa Japonica Group]
MEEFAGFRGMAIGGGSPAVGGGSNGRRGGGGATKAVGLEDGGGPRAAIRLRKEEEREGKGALADAVDTLRPAGEAGDDAVGRWRRGIGRWRWMCDGREWRWRNERGEGNGRRVREV